MSLSVRLPGVIKCIPCDALQRASPRSSNNKPMEKVACEKLTCEKLTCEKVGGGGLRSRLCHVRLQVCSREAAGTCTEHEASRLHRFWETARGYIIAGARCLDTVPARGAMEYIAIHISTPCRAAALCASRALAPCPLETISVQDSGL